jgi:hypothetical protein
MHCVICGHSIDRHSEGYVPTRSGELVHLTCAEREAQAAWSRRRCWAVIHAFSGTGITIAVALSHVQVSWLIALTMATSHMLIHRRWWYYVTKDLCRWASLKRH